MTLRLRQFGSDWGTVLTLIDAALPFDPDGNRQWLDHRRRFDTARRVRHHYLVEEAEPGAPPKPLAYGAIEQVAGNRRRFRLLIVADGAQLASGPGDLLMERLLAHLDAVEADRVWVREHARDSALLEFFGRWGFRTVERVWDLWLPLAGEEGPVPAPIAGPAAITTLAAEQRRIEDALPRLHRAIESLLAQAAGDRTPTTVPFAGFVHWLGQPGLSPQACFLARHGENYVGVSVWTVDPDQPALLRQQVTAVQAAYRPWDLATALRRAAMAYAGRQGYEGLVARVLSSDAQALAAHEALGFQRRFEYVTMEKETASPTG